MTEVRDDVSALREVVRSLVPRYDPDHPEDFGFTEQTVRAIRAALESEVKTTDQQRLELAREALVATGYFTREQVGLDIAPRITELWAARHSVTEPSDDYNDLALGNRAQQEASAPSGDALAALRTIETYIIRCGDPAMGTPTWREAMDARDVVFEALGEAKPTQPLDVERLAVAIALADQHTMQDVRGGIAGPQTRAQAARYAEYYNAGLDSETKTPDISGAHPFDAVHRAMSERGFTCGGTHMLGYGDCQYLTNTAVAAYRASTEAAEALARAYNNLIVAKGLGHGIVMDDWRAILAAMGDEDTAPRE